MWRLLPNARGVIMTHMLSMGVRIESYLWDVIPLYGATPRLVRLGLIPRQHSQHKRTKESCLAVYKKPR